MSIGRTIRMARRRAGLSQRALAERTGVAQPTIARIERGVDDPRFTTIQTLLAGCGEELVATPVAGEGIDRTEIRELLALSPAERLRQAVAEARVLEGLERATPVG
jgi:transcriptional regulator with XRE-family HTH domain